MPGDGETPVGRLARDYIIGGLVSSKADATWWQQSKQSMFQIFHVLYLQPQTSSSR